jgi:tetratricopeptide (TPR) repeat protein
MHDLKTAGTLPRWARPRGPKTLGVIMIVKDEAENLPSLFASIQDVADEVVVVDTGSTDGTLAICKQWQVTLLQDRWHDDFSRARNRSIKASTAKYLLWLDGDDRVPESTQDELRRLRDEVLPTASDRAYQFEIHNLDARGNIADTFLQPRLLPRVPGLRFRNAIHEEVVSSLEALRVEVVKLGTLAIEHTGYALPEVLLQKAARNETLLRKALQSEPDNVHQLVHLAQTLAVTKRYRQAEQAASDAIARLDAVGRPTLTAECHRLRSTIRLIIGDSLGAIYDLERAATLWPGWSVPYTALAEIRAAEGNWEGAWEMIGRARSGSFDPGVFGLPVARARSALERISGLVLLQRGSTAEGLACLRAALSLDPRNFDARLEFGQLLLERGEYGEALAVLEPVGEDEAAVDRFVDISASIGLARAAMGDMAGARACLAPLLDFFSAELNGADEVGPIELMEVLLRSGHGNAARNMFALFRMTMADAA